MKRFIRDRKAPAVIISMIALVVAAGGTAIAGPVAITAKSDSKQDKKLFNKLAKTASVSHASTADAATTAANSVKLGGQPASAYAGRFFARVNGTPTTPTLAAGSPGVTVEASRPFTGAVRVDFPVDMTNCAVVATGVTGGDEAAARQSTTSSGSTVVIVTYINGTNETNESFNVIAEC